MTEPLPGSMVYIIDTCIWYLVLGNKFVEGLPDSNSGEFYFSNNISGNCVYAYETYDQAFDIEVDRCNKGVFIPRGIG